MLWWRQGLRVFFSYWHCFSKPFKGMRPRREHPHGGYSLLPQRIKHGKQQLWQRFFFVWQKRVEQQARERSQAYKNVGSWSVPRLIPFKADRARKRAGRKPRWKRKRATTLKESAPRAISRRCIFLTWTKRNFRLFLCSAQRVLCSLENLDTKIMVEPTNHLSLVTPQSIPHSHNWYFFLVLHEKRK